MTIRQALNSSINRALTAGYLPLPNYSVIRFDVQINKMGFGFVAFLLENGEKKITGEAKRFEVTLSVADVIFDQGYAKAIWPGAVCGRCGRNNVKDCPGCDAPVVDAWKFHEQQLVLLSSNKGRLAYIGSTL